MAINKCPMILMSDNMCAVIGLGIGVPGAILVLSQNGYGVLLSASVLFFVFCAAGWWARSVEVCRQTHRHKKTERR